MNMSNSNTTAETCTERADWPIFDSMEIISFLANGSNDAMYIPEAKISESIFRSEDALISLFASKDQESTPKSELTNNGHGNPQNGYHSFDFDIRSSKDLNYTIKQGKFSSDLIFVSSDFGFTGLSKDDQICAPIVNPSVHLPGNEWAVNEYLEAVVQQGPEVGAPALSHVDPPSSTADIIQSEQMAAIESSAILITKPKGRRKKCVVKEFFIPTDEDVLLGRGGHSNKHPGNKRYRGEIEKVKKLYKCSSKQEKTKISQSLVDYVHGYGGRFIELDKPSGKWYEIHDVDARTKVSQALREENTEKSRKEKRIKYKKPKKAKCTKSSNKK